MYFALIFSGDLGTELRDMAPKVKIGPFETAAQACGAAALSIERLNGLHQDRDFCAACIKYSDLMSMQQLAQRAAYAS